MISFATADPTKTIDSHLMEGTSVVRRTFRSAEQTALARCTSHFPGNQTEQIRQFPQAFESAVIDAMDKNMTEGLAGNGCAQELIRSALRQVDWSQLCDVYRQYIADQLTVEDALMAYCFDKGIE